VLCTFCDKSFCQFRAGPVPSLWSHYITLVRCSHFPLSKWHRANRRPCVLPWYFAVSFS
jgi:hypothetical protein